MNNNQVLLTAEEAQAWRDDGVDGTREEIATMANTIIALYQRIKKLEDEYACCAFELDDLRHQGRD